jgi:putative flippase GtrA
MKNLLAHIPAFSRYGLVGAATAAVYFAVFALLHDIIGAGYQVAVSCGYAAGVAFHFVANRNLTFRKAGGHIGAQLTKYAIVVAINYVLTLIVVGVAVEFGGLSAYLGVLAAVAITTFVGYALFARWVFRPHHGCAVER